MRTYIADIIPKIQKFSQRLDNLSLLTNQHWIVLDEINNSKIVYIFRTNGELLIVTNGKVDKAKWEYLGESSILIDLKDESYMFRHGFFDENILALKVDSKEEYAVLINENKHKGELNSILDVNSFLKNKYLLNIIPDNKSLIEHRRFITDLKHIKDGYTFKMGSFKKFEIQFPSGQIFHVYQKKSNSKYFIYDNKDIILFSDKDTCLKYIENNII